MKAYLELDEIQRLGEAVINLCPACPITERPQQRRAIPETIPGGSEKPRLYLAMDKGIITIATGKNWHKEGRNPDGLQANFKLVKGSEFIVTRDWHYSELGENDGH